MKDHQHQWGSWIAYDPMIVEMGFTNGFLYRRDCMVFGCNAREKAVELQPVGKTEIVLEASK